MLPNWIREDEKVTPDQLPGLYREIAERLGVEAAYVLAEMYGGLQPYFPRLSRDHLKKRNHAIYHRYNQGATIDELARKYELTNTHIHRILAGVEEEINQLMLYDEDDEDDQQLEIAMDAD